MKKVLLGIAVLFSTVCLQAENVLDTLTKKQCQYMVYGNGERDNLTEMYILGAVQATLYLTPNEVRTEIADKATNMQIIELACKEALADTSINEFNAKVIRGINVTVDKDKAKYSLRK